MIPFLNIIMEHTKGLEWVFLNLNKFNEAESNKMMKFLVSSLFLPGILVYGFTSVFLLKFKKSPSLGFFAARIMIPLTTSTLTADLCFLLTKEEFDKQYLSLKEKYEKS